ncbi:MAG: efflux RND transporter periplasmic adaptor subunit [Phycisphaerae bacterium]
MTARGRHTLWGLTAVIVFAAVWGLWHWSHLPASSVTGDPAPAKPTAGTTRPTPRPAVASDMGIIVIRGTIEAFEIADLQAKVTGYVAIVNADIGDRVTAGAVLAVIDVPELADELAGAQAEHAARQAALKHAQADAELNVAHAAVALAEKQVQTARTQVDRLTTLVGYTKTVAPYDGVVTRRLVNRGVLVQAAPAKGGDAIFTLQRLDTVRVFADVPEADAAKVAIGTPAEGGP